jgi:large subunit ribosomal protein L24
MINSSKARTQRRFRFSAPLHKRQHFMRAHADKALRQKLGIQHASIRIAKGDTVKIMAGENFGKSAKVTLVNVKRGSIFLEGIVKKNAKGKEYSIPISPSNVYITDMDASYKGRIERLQGKPINKDKEAKK